MDDDTLPPPPSKLAATKERWAQDKRVPSARPGEAGAGRLPPGQRAVSGLPVLDLGEQPDIAPQDWRFSISGLVDRPLSLDWVAFQALPQVEVRADIHCVTAWSSFDNRFAGVPVRAVLEAAGLRPDARFVMARSFDGYATNLTLADLLADDVLLCHAWNGAPLPRAHGGPVRLVVPHLYFWKSAKWLRAFSVLAEDTPGYWEARGYHRRGDPWQEERYEE